MNECGGRAPASQTEVSLKRRRWGASAGGVRGVKLDGAARRRAAHPQVPRWKEIQIQRKKNEQEEEEEEERMLSEYEPKVKVNIRIRSTVQVCVYLVIAPCHGTERKNKNRDGARKAGRRTKDLSVSSNTGNKQTTATAAAETNGGLGLRSCLV